MTADELARGRELLANLRMDCTLMNADQCNEWRLQAADALDAAAEREAGLRDALEYYAWADHWTRDSPYDLPTMYGDKGARARRALV